MQFIAPDGATRTLRDGMLVHSLSSEVPRSPSLRPWMKKQFTALRQVNLFLLLATAGLLLLTGSFLGVANAPAAGTHEDEYAARELVKGAVAPVLAPARSLLAMSHDAERKLREEARQRAAQQGKQRGAGDTGAQQATDGATEMRMKGIGSPADISQFESIALRDSGWELVRPPMTPAASGEAFMRAVPFQVISWFPRITYYPGFLSPEEADHMVALAKKQLSPSGLTYRPGESIPKTQEVRTSNGCFLAPEHDPAGVLAGVEAKIAAVTHLPVENGEYFNVLRYQPGQHYDSHMDTFDPKEFGPQASQRVATFLIFLAAPEEGGETMFKREGQNGAARPIADWRSCEDGLGIKVKPKTGDAVLFWSLTPDLQIDPRALHGACPVIKGEKWSAAKWLHEKQVTPVRRQQQQRSVNGQQHAASGQAQPTHNRRVDMQRQA